MSNSTVIYFGASQGIAFAAYKKAAAARRNLKSVLLLRSISSFQNSAEYNSLDESILHRSLLVEGDVHNENDVRDLLWRGRESLEAIVFSIGFTPSASIRESVKTMISGTKTDPRDLCTRAFIILLKTLSEMYGDYEIPPKLIIVSSMGIGVQAQRTIPHVLQPLYSHGLQSSLEDKLAMEVVLANSLLTSSSNSFPSTRYVPHFFPFPAEINPTILSPEAFDELPEPFIAGPDVLVIRPALLTDTPERGWGLYRVAQDGKFPQGWSGAYSIGKEDVGGFIADILTGTNDEVTSWWGHQVVLGY